MRKLLALVCLVAVASGPAASLRAQNRDASADLAGLQAEYRDEQVRARRLRADAADAQTEMAGLERRTGRPATGPVAPTTSS